METKVCASCNIEKCIDEFSLTYVARKKGSSEKMSRCSICFKGVKSERLRKWRESNPEKVEKSRKKSYDKNKDYELEFHKQYVEKNKEKIKDYNKKFREENREILNEKRVKKYNEDKLYRLSTTIRNSIKASFIKFGYTKQSKTYKILGITYEEFKLYLESKFEDWMNWNNHGLYNGEFQYGWDIDHIIPVSSASSEEDIYRLNHYKNFQPLCSKTNRDIKRDKIH